MIPTALKFEGQTEGSQYFQQNGTKSNGGAQPNYTSMFDLIQVFINTKLICSNTKLICSVLGSIYLSDATMFLQ